jgi:hypothetical protein
MTTGLTNESGGEERTDSDPSLTLQDLLDAESEVLQRVARGHGNEQSMAGHYSTSYGHKSSGGHTSHVSAKVENPLDS